MHASDYLRMKLQSDRHLAMSVQNGFRGVIQTAKGVYGSYSCLIFYF